MRRQVAALIRSECVVAARVHRSRSMASVVGRHRVACDARCTPSPHADLRGLAAAIVKAIEGVEGPRDRVTLIVPARWCYTQRIELPNHRARESVAAYQLEEYLPTPLERVTCAFARDGGTQALGIAIPTEPMRTLLSKLSAAGVSVERIVPDVLCAGSAARGRNGSKREQDGAFGIMIRDADRRTFSLYDGHGSVPRAIRTVDVSETPGTDGGSLAEQVTLTEGAHAIHTKRWHVLDLATEQHLDAVMLAATNGAKAPNLAMAALAPSGSAGNVTTSLTRCVTLLAAVLIALSGYLHVRRGDYQDVLAETRSQVVTVYREVFPGAALPPGPAMRLASERLRLEALTRRQGAETSETSFPRTDPLAPLRALRELAAQIPSEVRVSVLEASVDEHQFAVRGHTRDHRDAERIAEAIGRIDGWTARPPRTSRLDNGGVEFAVHATRGDGSQGGEGG